MGDGVTLVICETGDIVGSIAREGRLADRLSRMRADAPPISMRALPGLRCDVLAQRLDANGHDRLQLPMALAPMLEALPLPDDVLLIVLSLSENLTADVVRHRATGWLLQLPPGTRDALGEQDRAWLETECEPAPSDVETAAAAITSLAEHATARAADLLVFNVSTFTPDEKQYWFAHGDPEPMAIHASRLDLMLDSLDAGLAVNVLDVDRIAAEYGAAEAVIAAGEYAAEFGDTLAEEAMRIIGELPHVSARFSPDAMSLVVPRYDRRTERGVLERWHVAAPAHVELGDALFDVRFDHLHTRLTGRQDMETNRTLRMSVVAGRSGYLESTSRTEGEAVEVGVAVGVMTMDAGVTAETEPVAPFPTGVRLVGR